MTAGAKSSEFWVVVALVLDLVAQRSGIYTGITADQAMDAAEQVRQLAEQIRGETGSDSGLVYLLGAVYVAGRAALKWRAAGPAAIAQSRTGA